MAMTTLFHFSKVEKGLGDEVFYARCCCSIRINSDCRARAVCCRFVLFFLLDQKEPKNQGCTDLRLKAITKA